MCQSKPPSNGDFTAPFNPFWVEAMMKKSIKGEASVDEATKYYRERSFEGREFFDKNLCTFLQARVKRKRSGHSLAFLWFLVTQFNAKTSFNLVFLTLLYTVFRVGYQVLFTIMMLVLGATADGSLLSRDSLPPTWAVLIAFCISIVGSSWIGNMVDQ